MSKLKNLFLVAFISLFSCATILTKYTGKASAVSFNDISGTFSCDLKFTEVQKDGPVLYLDYYEQFQSTSKLKIMAPIADTPSAKIVSSECKDTKGKKVSNSMQFAPSLVEPNLWYGYVNITGTTSFGPLLELKIKQCDESGCVGSVGARSGGGAEGILVRDDLGFDIFIADANNAIFNKFKSNFEKLKNGQDQGITDVNNSGSDPSCESEGGSFAWILCSGVSLIDGAVGVLDSAINDLLYVKYDKYTQSGGLELAWQRTRNLAYIILIPIMLIMIISTALGFRFVDAYTVKRALPRMLVAIIFIAVSWEVCRMIIEITNAAGRGMSGLIGSVINSDGLTINTLTLKNIFSVGQGATVTALGLGGTIIGGFGVYVISKSVLFPYILGIVFLFLISIFLALIVLFLVLGFRQMLIMGLVIVAPLAVLSWIFPGNDKLWKLWWNSFSKLLLLFPVIIILITTGKVFAYIVATSGGADNALAGSGLVDFILKISAYFLPYFLIPATFKFAGGVFANVAGMANDRTKGLFDRNKNLRKKLAGSAKKKGWERARQGKFLLGGEGHNRTEKWNHRLGRLTNMDAAFDGGIRKAFSKEYRGSQIDSRETDHRVHEMLEILKEQNPHLKFDDFAGVMAAVLGEASPEDMRDRLLKIWSEKGDKYQKFVEFEKDENGNIVRDEKGKAIVAKDEMGVTKLTEEGQKFLDQTVDTAMKIHHNQGSSASAEYLLRANRAFENPDGTTNEAGLKEYIAYLDRMKRTHNEQALEMAAMQAANEGGTYYMNEEHMWRAAMKATRGNSTLQAHMAATQRGVAINSGRGDLGGGAFGASFGRMSEIAAIDEEIANARRLNAEDLKKVENSGNNDLIEETKKSNAKRLQDLKDKRYIAMDKYADHMAENTPASIALHYSMKTGSMGRNWANTIVRRLRKRAEAAEKAGEGSAAHNQYVQELAAVNAIYQQARTSKPELANLISKQIMGATIPTITRQVDVVTRNEAGEEVPGKRDVVARTVLEHVKAAQSFDSSWEQHNFEYSSRLAQEMAGMQAAAAAAEAAKAGATSTVGKPPGTKLGG